VYQGQTKKVAFAKNLFQSDPRKAQIHDMLSATQTNLADEMQQDLDE
jgi:hypothetical protein